MIKFKKQKGFTLIELLVVIAIIAILAVVVVLTLNPAELLRQARDSNRESDFATLKSAIGLYAEDVATSTPLYGSVNVASDTLYTANASVPSSSDAYYETSNTSLNATTTSSGGNWGFSSSTGANNYGSGVITTNTSRSINGTGWLPINFNLISSGAPIGSLPVDPVNSQSNMYIFAASGTVYKLATKMESVKYSCTGSGDVESTDGGNAPCTYEQGTNLNL